MGTAFTHFRRYFPRCVIPLVMVLFLLVPAVSAICPAILTVTSTPSAAAVFIDGAYLGTTPLNKTSLNTGQHTIMLSHAGYLDTSRTIDLICDSSVTKDYVLDPLPSITLTPVPVRIPVQPLPPQVQQVPVRPGVNRAVPPHSSPQKVPVSSIPGRFTGNYPVGFSGLSFNTEGQNILDLDLDAARNAGAEVTSYPDRIEIYQHSSPAVLITLWGNNFETRNGKISGKVNGADVATSSLEGNIPVGEVSGSVQVELYALDGPGELTKTINANVTPEVESVFRNICARNNFSYIATAYVMDISKFNLDRTGAANLTLTLPLSWVNAHGGAGSVKIIRISEKDQAVRILDTSYFVPDSGDSLVVTAYSPDGTSIFGIITAEALSRKGIEPSGGQMMLDLKMLILISGMVAERPYFILIGTVIVLAGFYFGRKKPET